MVESYSIYALIAWQMRTQSTSSSQILSNVKAEESMPTDFAKNSAKDAFQQLGIRSCEAKPKERFDPEFNSVLLDTPRESLQMRMNDFG